MTPRRLYDPEAMRFSRAWWFAQGKSLLWVAAVTALIWVYADMEFIDTEDLTVTVRLATSDPDRVVLLNDRDEEMPVVEMKFSFRVRGSRSNLDRLKGRLSAPGPHLIHDVSRDREPGRHEVPAVDIVRELPDLGKLALSALSAVPSKVKIHLDEVVRQEVPVQLRYKGARLSEEPEPQKVTVKVASVRWGHIRARMAEPRLQTRELDLSDRAPSEQVTREVEVVPEIAEIPVRLARSRLTYSVQIAPAAEPQVVTDVVRVDVQVLTPPAWATDDTWQKFVFTQDTTKQPWKNIPITVSGPAEDIARLKDRQSEVQAYLVLDENDKTHMDTPWEKPVVIRFPEGLRVKLVGEPPKVSFYIRKRSPS